MKRTDGMNAWQEAATIITNASDNPEEFAHALSDFTGNDAGVPAGLFMLIAQILGQPELRTNYADALGHMGLTGFLAGMLYERDQPHPND